MKLVKSWAMGYHHDMIAFLPLLPLLLAAALDSEPASDDMANVETLTGRMRTEHAKVELGYRRLQSLLSEMRADDDPRLLQQAVELMKEIDRAYIRLWAMASEMVLILNDSSIPVQMSWYSTPITRMCPPIRELPVGKVSQELPSILLEPLVLSTERALDVETDGRHDWLLLDMSWEGFEPTWTVLSDERHYDSLQGALQHMGVDFPQRSQV